MASPASSVATMAAESIDGDVLRSLGTHDNQAANCKASREEEHVQPFQTLSNPESDEGLIFLDRYKNPADDATLSPSILVARNPDPQILEDVLQESQLSYYPTNIKDFERRKHLKLTLDPISRDEFGSDCWRYNRDIGITTPLLEAIRAGLGENVQVLLDEGADPNGPLCLIEAYSAFFLRFRPAIPSNPANDVARRTDFLDRMDLPQLSSLTSEEVEDRFWQGMAPFWCEQDFVPANFFSNGEAIPAIVEAARSGSIMIVDQLINNGADTSFWMTPQFYVPAHSTPSSLSVSSPIHAALQARDISMLNHLLGLGFDPNTMPLANPTRCFTPLMAVIIQHEDFDYLAFDILAGRHRSINFELRTPIYGVHILHFAVATLNLEMLKHIIRYTPLKNAGITALGHTLLHIACMPANSLEVQRHSELIYNSIRETRDLNAQNDSFANCPPLDPTIESNPWKTDFEAQTAVVKFLCSAGINNVDAEDVHGNTALHYLCGYRDINQELLYWLLEEPGAHQNFTGSTNIHGATPEDLLCESASARESESSGWKPWFDRVGREERVARKQAIWRDLLGNAALRSF